MYVARKGSPGSRQASAYAPCSALRWIGTRGTLYVRIAAMARVFEPEIADVLAFCRRDPVERVFLEDVARRGHGRFLATREGDGLAALCHLGTNVVPSGEGCDAFADAAAKVGPRMLIGEERAVSELYD